MENLVLSQIGPCELNPLATSTFISKIVEKIGVGVETSGSIFPDGPCVTTPASDRGVPRSMISHDKGRGFPSASVSSLSKGSQVYGEYSPKCTSRGL